MKIKELLNEAEQLDEIPKWMGGTGMGGGLPGTDNGGIRGAIGTGIKKFTGMGTGGALLKQAKRTAKAYYKQWLTIVPTLQQTGRVMAGDADSYIENLMLFTQKKFGLKKKEDLDKFKATVGDMPNRSSIIRGFEEAFQNAVAQNQLGNAPRGTTQNSPPAANPQAGNASTPGSNATGGVQRMLNGTPFLWNGTEWVGAISKRPVNPSIAKKLNAMGPV